MTTQKSALDLASPRASAGVVVAVTADDDRYAAVRREAAELARRESARLILYDWDAPGIFGDPLPSVWSADGTDRAVPDELDERQLVAAGRSTIAAQVTEERVDGLAVSAWLPSTRDPAALAKYAMDHGATAVVVPSGIRELTDLASSFEPPIRLVEITTE